MSDSCHCPETGCWRLLIEASGSQGISRSGRECQRAGWHSETRTIVNQ